MLMFGTIVQPLCNKQSKIVLTSAEMGIINGEFQINIVAKRRTLLRKSILNGFESKPSAPNRTPRPVCHERGGHHQKDRG